MIATLMKLFDIKMVASNFFGVVKSFLTLLLALDSSEFNFSFSLGFREKNATSEPDINAENIRSINNTTKDITTPKEIGLKNPESKINVNKGPGSSNS